MAEKTAAMSDQGRCRKDKTKRACKQKKRKNTDELEFQYIRVGYWNCASAKQRGTAIPDLVNKFDILMLQETREEKTENIIQCPGYDCYPYPSGKNKLGLAIYIREEIQHKELNVEQYCKGGIEIQGLTVLVKTQEWGIYNVYAHIQHLTRECNWNFLSEIANSHGKCLIAGDFNARSKEWGNITEYKQGIALSNALLSFSLNVLNDGRATRPNRNRDSNGVIDLALISSTEAISAGWDVLEAHDSDHLPCMVLISKGDKVAQVRPIHAFTYNEESKDTSATLLSLRKVVRQKTRKTDFVQPPWWNAEVEKAWSEKKQAFKQWQKLRNSQPRNVNEVEERRKEKQRKCKIFKTLAKKSKAQVWENFVTEVPGKETLQKFWQLQERMDRKCVSRKIPNIQTLGGTMLTTDEEKGQAFIERYLRQSTEVDRSACQKTRKYIQQSAIQSKIYVDLVTIDDIKCALQGSDSNTAGPDGVQYYDIKQLSDEELQCVVRDFNESIQASKAPEDWLDTYLQPYLKLGRDPSQLSSYGIMASPNVYGDLLEKTVSKKIIDDLERRSLLPKTMGGYKPSKTTWDSAGIFAYDVCEGFQRKQETVAVSIDLEDVYSMVNYDYLLRRMLDFGIDGWLVNLVAAMLMPRTVAFRLGTWTSEPLYICPGLPLGSPLSPVLFSIYTAKLAEIQPAGLGRTLLFADELLLYRTGTDREEMVNDINETLVKMSRWCAKADSEMNPERASVLFCSLKPDIGKAVLPTIYLNKRRVQRRKTLKYSGVTFNRRLSYQIDRTIIKCKRGLAALKTVVVTTMEQRLLFLLFKKLILSVIDCELGLLSLLTLSESQYEILEKIQNEGMRIVLGCTRDTPIRTMRYTLGLPSVKSRHDLAQVKACSRIINDETHPLFYNLIDNDKGRRLEKRQSWMAQAEDTYNQFTSDLERKAMDIKEIIKKIYERMLVRDTSTTESVRARMREFGIERGSGRRGHLRGRMRLVYNQRVTEIISIYTLQHLLRSMEQLVFTDGSGKFVFTEGRGKFVLTEDSGKFVFTEGSGKFVYTEGRGKFVLTEDSGKFVFTEGRGKFVLTEDSGKFVFTEGSGKFVFTEGSGKFVLTEDSEKFVFTDDSGKFVFTEGSGKFVFTEGSGKFVFTDDSGKFVYTEGSGKFVFAEGSWKFVFTEGSGKFVFTDGCGKLVFTESCGKFVFTKGSGKFFSTDGSRKFVFTEGSGKFTFANSSGKFVFTEGSRNFVFTEGSGKFVFTESSVNFAFVDSNGKLCPCREYQESGSPRTSWK